MINATLRSIPIAALALLLAAPALAQSSNVTFRVDMSAAIANCRVIPGFTEISVPGSFNEWSPRAWVLTDDDGDGIYTGTFQIPDGSHEFKFHGHPQYLLGGWDDGANRTLTVSGDATLDVATFVRTFTSICPPEGQHQVTFRVDMSAAHERCALTSESVITVPGSHNLWDATANRLNNIGANVFANTFNLAPGEISYKFFGTPEDRIGWEDDPNRTANITGNTLLPLVAFRKTFADFCQAAVFEINFQVDMSIQAATGAFNPNTDRVYVAGAAFGWGPGADNRMTHNPLADEEWLFTASITRELAIPSDNPYKFIFVDANDVVHWESGPDRIFRVTETSPSVINVPKRFFSDVGPDDILREAKTIRIVLDLRPAYYYLADHGRLPDDIQTGEVTPPVIGGVWLNGPLGLRAQEVTGAEWATWGEALAAIEPRRFYDDGATGGDLVAGDSLFTRTYTYPAGTPRVLIGKWGVNGFDNESGFGVDHHVHLAGTEIRVIFGCMRQADGTFVAHFDNDPAGRFRNAYQPYLRIDNAASPPTCTVVRSGGGVVGVEPTGRAPEGLRLLANFPNPARLSTTFEYSIPSATEVRLEVFDLMGRRVATLVNETQQANTYRVWFDTSDLASGSYVIRLTAGDSVLTQRMTVIR